MPLSLAAALVVVVDVEDVRGGGGEAKSNESSAPKVRVKSSSWRAEWERDRAWSEGGGEAISERETRRAREERQRTRLLVTGRV